MGFADIVVEYFIPAAVGFAAGGYVLYSGAADGIAEAVTDFDYMQMIVKSGVGGLSAIVAAAPVMAATTARGSSDGGYNQD